MTSPAPDIAALYKNRPVYLWVEDELTRTYLDAAWGPQGDIGLLIARNSENVRTIVTNARKEGLTNVFGLQDRDFGAGGFGDWDRKRPVLRLDSHEVENFLLDPAALATNVLNRSKRSVAEIEQRLFEAAQGMTWGMALGATMQWLRTKLFDQFPASGSLVTVASERDALSRILDGGWLQHVQGFPGALTSEAIAARLREFEVEFRKQLETNEWRKSFGGKEILSRVLSWVAPADIPGKKDEALAREVGRFHAAHGRPPEVEALRQLLFDVARVARR